MVTLGRDISVLCLCLSYCGQEYTQGHAQALRRRMFPPAALAWEAFRKVTLIALWVASQVMVKSCTSVRDAIRSTPGASPPHLGGRTRRDEYVACVGKGQTKSNQEGKAFGVVCLHPHLGQRGTPPVERWSWSIFFLSYRWELTIPVSLL